MLDLGARLRLGSLDLALHSVQQAAFSVQLVGAAARCNLPDDLASFVLGPFLHPVIASIGMHRLLFAMQQPVDLSHVRHVGRCAYHAMHQTGCRACRPCSSSNWEHGSAWRRRWCPGAATPDSGSLLQDFPKTPAHFCVFSRRGHLSAAMPWRVCRKFV